MRTKLALLLLYIAIAALAALIAASAVAAQYEIKQARQADYTLALMQSNLELTDQLAEGLEIAESLQLSYLGEFEVTHYCYNSGYTKSGTRVLEGRTVAVNMDQIPPGSLIYIENVGFRLAEDTGGGIERNELDLYVKNKAECIKLGRKEARVWIISQNTQ